MLYLSTVLIGYSSNWICELFEEKTRECQTQTLVQAPRDVSLVSLNFEAVCVESNFFCCVIFVLQLEEFSNHHHIIVLLFYNVSYSFGAHLCG